jgi:hypothetical protein
MAILILIGVVCVLFLLHRLGFLLRFPLSWDLVRRIFLYILLLLGLLGFLSKAWSIVVSLEHLPPRWLISPSGNPIIDIVSTVTLGIALYGIWRWKKWGAYLVLVRLAFTIAIQLFVYRSLSWRLFHNYTGRENVFADLSGAVMWIIAFSLTWKHFE